MTEPIEGHRVSHHEEQLGDPVDPVLRNFLNSPHTMPSMYVHETDGVGKWQVIAQFTSPPQQSVFAQIGLELIKQTNVIDKSKHLTWHKNQF